MIGEQSDYLISNYRILYLILLSDDKRKARVVMNVTDSLTIIYRKMSTSISSITENLYRY